MIVVLSLRIAVILLVVVEGLLVVVERRSKHMAQALVNLQNQVNRLQGNVTQILAGVNGEDPAAVQKAADNIAAENDRLETALVPKP
jgi:uncharacterized protein YjeT (DUF2065 family)